MGSDAVGTPKDTMQKHPLHWHVMLTHLPIGTFSGAMLFMTLHVATDDACYSKAAYVSLIAGAAVMLPTTGTGWFTWQQRYRGTHLTLFAIKIWTSVVMLTLVAALVAYQTAVPFSTTNVADLPHILYFVGVLLLMAGAVVEGYWGSQLHHR